MRRVQVRGLFMREYLNKCKCTASLWLCVCECLCVHTHTHIYTYIRTFMYTIIHTYTHKQIIASVPPCGYAEAGKAMQAHLHTHACIHTYTHTYTHSMVGVGSSLWLYGGEKRNSTQIYNDLWSFNTSSMRWTETPRLISAPRKGKSRHSMTVVCT